MTYSLRAEVLTWLQNRGWCQRDLAHAAKINQTTLSFILRGKQSPSVDVALTLARITGIPAERWAGERVRILAAGSTGLGTSGVPSGVTGGSAAR